MRTITKLFSLVVFLFILSCNQANVENKDKITDGFSASPRGIGDSCIGDPLTTGSCDTLVYAWQIALPQYPDCLFEVSLNGFVCYGLNAIAIHVGEFEIDSDLGCSDFEQDITNAITNGTEDQFYVEFNQSVWRVVTSNILNGYVPQNTTILEIEYIIGSCKYLCFTEALDCGNACCRKINIWNDINGRWVLEKEGEIEHWGEACPDDPIDHCPNNVLQSASCFDNCASLDF